MSHTRCNKLRLIQDLNLFVLWPDWRLCIAAYLYALRRFMVTFVVGKDHTLTLPVHSLQRNRKPGRTKYGFTFLAEISKECNYIIIISDLIYDNHKISLHFTYFWFLIFSCIKDSSDLIVPLSRYFFT